MNVKDNKKVGCSKPGFATLGFPYTRNFISGSVTRIDSVVLRKRLFFCFTANCLRKKNHFKFSAVY
jgi:hypothetical protein